MKDTYRVYLQITLTVDATSFEDAEFKTLTSFEHCKPRENFINIEDMSVDGMDEL